MSKKSITKKVFQYITHSNAAPFVSDRDEGFIEAIDPMTALREVVKKYNHPSGLFSAIICEPSPKNPVLARYLSARAATEDAALCGLAKETEDDFYVNDRRMPRRQGIYELVKPKRRNK